MKIRKGFVSNSSSSSFICDITGEEVQGYDLGLEEAEMYQCKNDHYFMDEFLIGDLPADLEDGRWGIPPENCPICSFQYIEENNLVSYLVKTYNITYQDAFDFMKNKSKRLRKMRNTYYFGVLEQRFDITKNKLQDEVKSKFNNLEEFENYLREE